MEEPSAAPTPKRKHAKKAPGTLIFETGPKEPQQIDDPKVRSLIVGAMAAGANVLIAASIAVASGFERVTARMIEERREQDEVFRHQIETAAARSDSLVAMSLYRKATQGDGDTTAMIFWLKNRQPHLWRDRKELEVAIGDVPGALRTAADRARERKRLMRDAILAELACCDHAKHEGICPEPGCGCTGEITTLVPYKPNGNGNGNGHG